MKEIENPLIANISRSNGNIEVSIAKKFSKAEEPVFKKFMGMCATDNDMFTNTKDMDKDQTMKACGMQYDKMRAMMNEVGKGGLTEKQKKLPPALQKAILKKMKEDGKISEEEAEAAYSKLLSKDDQKKVELAPQDDMKKIDNPKEVKIPKKENG